MKLILEAAESSDINYLIEDKQDGKKQYFIEGIFLQDDKKNRNQRIYPKPVLENQVNRFQKMISENRGTGELGHPGSPAINLDKISHLITKLTFESKDVIGKAKIIDTPMGKIAKNLLDEGIKLGVSSRGIGNVKMMEGASVVQNDFLLNAIDIVYDPSGVDCWVNGIMESEDWVMDAAGNWKMVEQIQEEVKRTSSRDLEKKQLELFNRFLQIIK